MEYVFSSHVLVVVNIILLHIGGDFIHSVLVVACLQICLFCFVFVSLTLSNKPLSQFSEVCVEVMPFYPFPGILSYTHSGC